MKGSAGPSRENGVGAAEAVQLGQYLQVTIPIMVNCGHSPWTQVREASIYVDVGLYAGLGPCMICPSIWTKAGGWGERAELKRGISCDP